MIYKDFSIEKLNSFGIYCKAKRYISIENELSLENISPKVINDKILILGGGSNIIFANNYFDGTILHIQNKGIEIIEEDNESAIVEIKAGENWNDVVVWSTKNMLWGIENLSAVYGNAGAVAVQNIGAYGCEIKDSFLECLTYNIKEKSWKRFSKQDCKFDYRYSIFKYQKQLNVIWSIRLRLSKIPKINLSYEAIKKEVENNNLKIETPLQMSNLVRDIRNRKLPDPNILGNCGSFFKNPIITYKEFIILKEKFPTIPFYDAENNCKKIPAAFLIETLGYKGKRVGNVGMHSHQALVMVNYGGALGEEVIFLANEITNKVKEIFNINLEKEVHIIL
ncbi:MAG: UDP-N-acetylmuramate dehydrogenase [Bacteroidales bacterium]|jgi:UDP-N-acetylmuramate dehydrogenase|nr:UDP-N-acetylmuramate dehydrogenase [Bacteroidales bacterium]